MSQEPEFYVRRPLEQTATNDETSHARGRAGTMKTSMKCTCCAMITVVIGVLATSGCSGKRVDGQQTTEANATRPSDPSPSALRPSTQSPQEQEKSAVSTEPNSPQPRYETATFGAGCFWCVEAVFQEVRGVKSVVSGYMGGSVKNPTYEQVCTGLTGHAEVTQIQFDPSEVSFKELLEVFWKTHDPTTLNRQGADSGTQYRSAVFYHNAQQKEVAAEYKRKLDESGAFSAPIVTEIAGASEFYAAEDYHQNYYRDNPDQRYCAYVIQPKMEKFRSVFRDKLTSESSPTRPGQSQE